MNNSKYKIGVNFSKNNIYYYLRVGTPPLNPLIPIFKVRKGDYTLNIINFNFSYSYLFNKLRFRIIFDNMTPIEIINNSDISQSPINNQNSIDSNISSEDKLKMFTKLYLIISYTIK
jgi:hypothetical protein